MTIISKKQLLAFAAYFVLYEMTCYLSNDMIMPAMLQVVKEFNAPLSSIALSLTFFIIGGSTLQIFLGPIADLIGKRKVMLFGNLLFLLATLFIPFASSINQFLAARFFQGMGMCFIFVGYAMIHEYFDDVEAVKLTSILANIAIFAPLVGPIVGSGISSISHWEFIFIVSGILGVISLVGLYKFMPMGKISQTKINLSAILSSYRVIFTHKTFMFGIFINAIACVPVIAWIGLSPTIIMNKMHQSFTLYIIYQSIMFGGFMISSTLMQKIAGRFSFKRIIKNGGTGALIGLIIAAIFHSYGAVFISGMFIYAFGFGICNGVIVRISLMSTGESSSLSTAAFSLLNSIYLSLGLELYNIVCGWLDYSLLSYVLCNIPLGIVVYLCALKFAKMNESLAWMESPLVDTLPH
jgi:DHA1 family multidrug/chloramphenicol efflux transport protein-like MFS transporter